MTSRLGFLEFPLRYLVAIGVAVLVGLASLAFVRVTVADLQLRAQKQALERDIAALKAQNQGLQGQVEYLQTDDAIEKLAREELGWTKPGDTAVVVVRPFAAATLTPTK